MVKESVWNSDLGSKVRSKKQGLVVTEVEKELEAPPTAVMWKQEPLVGMFGQFQKGQSGEDFEDDKAAPAMGAMKPQPVLFRVNCRYNPDDDDGAT